MSRVLALGLLLGVAAGSHAVPVEIEVPQPLYDTVRTVVGSPATPAAEAEVRAWVQRQVTPLLQSVAQQAVTQQAREVAEHYLAGDLAARQAWWTAQAAPERAGPGLLRRGYAWMASGLAWGLSWIGGWLVGYLWWEWRPCRRVLFGVVRRLYGRSLED